MEELVHILANEKRWDRKVLNLYWIIVAVSIAVEMISLFFTEENRLDFFYNFVLVPAVLFAGVMAIAEIINHNLKSRTPYLTIVTGTILAAILISIHSEVDMILGILLLPILISNIYLDCKKVLFASIVSSVAFILLYVFHPLLSKEHSLHDLITMAFLIIVSAYTSNRMIHRGEEIIAELEKTIQTKQDLMIHKTIMEKISKSDGLTELNNHISFHEYLDKLIEQSERYELPIQLALLDIDNFKQINDTYGHRTGDMVLKSVSQIIQKNITPDEVSARYGGEEFAVIFTNKTFGQAYEIAEKIRKELEVTEVLDGWKITISIGLHEFRKGDDKEALFEGADAALYHAKRNGKNQTCIYENKVIKSTLCR